MRTLSFASSAILLMGCVSDTAIAIVQLPDATPPDASVPDTSIVDASPPDASPSATITINPAMPILRQGSNLAVTVNIARNGLTGPIALVASGAQTGTTITIPAIADGTTMATMTITTDAKADVGSAPITLKASGVVDFTFTLVVEGPAGTLDPSFNQSGIVLDTNTPTGTFNAVAAQPDGKVIVAGSVNNSGWLIRRYNVDGSPDVVFNANAAKILPNVATNAARGIALDPKLGRIVIVGGVTNEAVIVVRLNADGTPDLSFHQSGFNAFTLIPYGGGGSRANAAFVLADSSIVVGGQALGPRDGLVLRFLENGDQDVAYAYQAPGDMNAILGLANGEVLGVGSNFPPNPPNPITVAVLNTGAVDKNYGTNGSQLVSQTQCNISGATRTTNGDVFMVGGFTGFPSICQVRVNKSGAFLWQSGGFVPNGAMGGAAAGPNDTTYEDGWSGGSQQRAGFIRRRLKTGALDTTFGQTGELLYNDIQIPNAFSIFFRAITTMADGRVVAVGARSGTSAGPVMYRVWP